MTDVNGPTDVEPGDLVDCGVPGKRAGVAVVVTAHRARLLVRFPNGELLTAAYTRKVHDGGFLRRTYVRRNFARLDAAERWWHAVPKTPDVSPTKGAMHTCPTVIVKADALRDRPADVFVQLNELNAWLATQPAKGAR